jgi:hypothetical protein
MGDQPRYRTLVESEQYTALFDMIAAKYPAHILRRLLSGVMWGIAKNPQAYNRVLGGIRIAKTRSFGQAFPTFSVLFQIQNEGEDDENVLLKWIEEASANDEAIEYLM